MASGGNKTIGVLVDLEKGILIPEITYDYGQLIFINAPENYINEYFNKKIKVTYDGTEYELTVKNVNANDSNFYYVGGELLDINNIDFTNYPFLISWFYQNQWYGHIDFETGSSISHTIKVEAIKEEPTPTPAPTKPKKKNLLTVLKKFFTNLSGQEPKGNNLIEVIDNGADNIQNNNNSNSSSSNESGSADFDIVLTYENSNYSANVTKTELIQAVKTGKRIFITDDNVGRCLATTQYVFEDDSAGEEAIEENVVVACTIIMVQRMDDSHTSNMIKNYIITWEYNNEIWEQQVYDVGTNIFGT